MFRKIRVHKRREVLKKKKIDNRNRRVCCLRRGVERRKFLGKTEVFSGSKNGQQKLKRPLDTEV